MAWGRVFETVLSGGDYNLLKPSIFANIVTGLALPRVFEP
jgi:hypothetical protein